MDWQLTLTCLAIGAAAAFIVWHGQRVLRGMRGGCSGGCGCSKTKPDAETQPALISPEQLVMRRRPTHARE